VAHFRKEEKCIMTNPPQSTSTNNLSDRLIKIEVLLEQVLMELKKGDIKFEKMENRIMQLEKQQSYWQGGLALLAIIWTAVLKWLP
jgi:hypothetical protein